MPTQFTACWNRQFRQIDLRSQELLSSTRPVPVCYPGNLTQDTQQEAENRWATFEKAGDPVEEKKWLLRIQTDLFLTSWMEQSRKSGYATRQFEKFRHRHLGTENSAVQKQRKHLTHFQRIVAKMCDNDYEMAEELMVETFTAAHHHFPQLTDLGDEEKERRWLVTILKRKLIDRKRKLKAVERQTGGTILPLDEMRGL